MNSKIEPSKSASAASADIVKYVLSALLVIAGLFVWFWFSAPERATQFGAWTPQLRALAVIVGLAAGAFVFLGTGKGRETREFMSESRFELRKVVWPTRDQLQTYFWAVLVFVLFVIAYVGLLDLGLGTALLKVFAR